MDIRRLVLICIFCFSSFWLWNAWQNYAVTSGSAAAVPLPSQAATNGQSTPSPTSALPASNETAVVPTGERINIKTDVIDADIALQGGDLVDLKLLKHLAADDRGKPFELLYANGANVYVTQSGLIGTGLPNHKSLWRVAGSVPVLKDGENSVKLTLEADAVDGKVIQKTYTFHRGSYLIDIAYAGVSAGNSAYFQIVRDGSTQASHLGASTFTGPAVYTEQNKYQKVTFEDINKGQAKFATAGSDGWLAMVQHYFVAAWIPAQGVQREYSIRRQADNLYASGLILPAVGNTISIKFYAGPEDQDKLESIAPGLSLTVDYGWLAIIASPLFWILKNIHAVVGNWGWAIILLTVAIKLVFFPLSAASYRSMAKMKQVMPKIQKLKEVYADDKMRLNQEMMEIYKKEKINPLGGCLPVVVQIPVFIALYWMLLGSVEMRNAPWMLWITDLSTKDPYYILPLIMGASMLLQTKLNPTPPDPMQAKVMMMMPIVFTGMFLFFPSGLVLYWIVNNVLSIAQQWQINRMLLPKG